MRPLIERLREAGSTGLDLSPGDPMCAEAAAEITRLRSVLAFYADPFKHGVAVPDFYSELDFGSKAAEAIAT